jgi:hypothetical protein
MRLPASARAAKNVVSQRVGDEAILLNLKTGVYWGLNASGAAVWQQMQKTSSVPSIVAALQEEFDASEEELHSAVGELLVELSREGLVVLE